MKEEFGRSEFLDNVITAWLNKVDDVTKNGTPSWSTLVAALRNPRIGQMGIANKIAEDKGIH